MGLLPISLFLAALSAAAQAPPPAAPSPSAGTPVALPAGVQLYANIPYSEFPQTVLDIYEPASKGTEKRPGVLVIHGGGWTGGTKEQVVESFVLPWVERGFVVANVEYRLAAAAPAPAAVTDVLHAAKWFRDNGRRWNVDTRRVVVTATRLAGISRSWSE